MLTSNKDSNNKDNVDNLKPQIQTEIKNLNNLNIEDNLIESNDNHNLFNSNKNYILKSDIYQSVFKDINSFNSGKINNNNLFS
jgi:ABC-type transporter Mla subunit MlaD